MKTSWRDLCKISWRCLKGVLKTSCRCLEDVLAKGVVNKRRRRLENVLKTSWRRKTKTNILVLIFWKYMNNANIFVLIKTSSEDEDERHLQDVFTKTNVCWTLLVDLLKKQPSIYKPAKHLWWNLWQGHEYTPEIGPKTPFWSSY